MFQEQERMAYQSIHAPEALRQKVMAKKPVRHLPMYLTTALAACLALVIGLGFLFRGGEPGISVNGQTLKDSIVYYDLSVADLRSAPVLTVPVDLELSGESEISVSHGSLIREGESPVSRLTASDDLSLSWQISKTEEIPICEMTITQGKDVTTITLEYNQSEITITKKGE